MLIEWSCRISHVWKVGCWQILDLSGTGIWWSLSDFMTALILLECGQIPIVLLLDLVSGRFRLDASRFLFDAGEDLGLTLHSHRRWRFAFDRYQDKKLSCDAGPHCPQALNLYLPVEGCPVDAPGSVCCRRFVVDAAPVMPEKISVSCWVLCRFSSW